MERAHIQEAEHLSGGVCWIELGTTDQAGAHFLRKDCHFSRTLGRSIVERATVNATAGAIGRSGKSGFEHAEAAARRQMRRFVAALPLA